MSSRFRLWAGCVNLSSDKNSFHVAILRDWIVQWANVLTSVAPVAVVAVVA